MATNLAQRELREKQSPKGNLLKGIAVGWSNAKSTIPTSTGWMKKKGKVDLKRAAEETLKVNANKKLTPETRQKMNDIILRQMK